MSTNKLISILLFIAILILFFRFGIMIFRIGLRYWFITIPVILFFYWKPKKKAKNYPTDLDPNKEIKPNKEPTIIDDDEIQDDNK